MIHLLSGEGILPLLFCGKAILALLSRGEGILPSNRGQDARHTQGRDALATPYLNYALPHDLLKTSAGHIIQCGTIDINPKVQVV
jgi:hypothetical protein